MNKQIKTMISTTFAAMLMLSLVGCGQTDAEVPNQSEDIGIQQDKITDAFAPKYSSDTEYKLSVAGTYSNFESLESTIDRFYDYYPNGEIEYKYLDDYRNTISLALAGQEPPDIYVIQPWMYGDEQFSSLFDGAEVLSATELEINLDCIRPSVKWEMDDGEIRTLPVFATSYGMLVNMDIM